MPPKIAIKFVFRTHPASTRYLGESNVFGSTVGNIQALFAPKALYSSIPILQRQRFPLFAPAAKPLGGNSYELTTEWKKAQNHSTLKTGVSFPDWHS